MHASRVPARAPDADRRDDGWTLRIDGIGKAFGSTQAIQAASLELRPGEVHCVVGENGSGKSTLVKILAGIHAPDRGTLTVGGREYRRLATPRQAAELGIATVFQEVLVLEPRSVLENVWVGTDGLLRTRRSLERKRERAAEVLGALLGEAPPLDRPVGELSLSERQACCIARSLVRDPRTLILDESTSALDVETRDRLFALVRERVADGASVIFISHRMDEIAEIGDRCTVMRSGETVATLDRGSATATELVRLMTGDDHLAPRSAREGAARTPVGDVVLRARGIVLRRGGAPIDLELRAGELVGLAGLEGHGQDAFIKALAGQARAGGELVACGGEQERPIDAPAAALEAGIAYVPRERRAESLLASKSIRENFGLPTLGRDRRGPLVSPRATARRLDAYVDRLSIKLGTPEDPITTLSGGNQQKVVMARWLATEPRVLLLNDPTRGVDIGAKRELYELLAQLAGQGMAVVMLSTEVDEHIELMDRVLVFREQRVAAEIGRAQLRSERLVGAFFGEGSDDA